MRNNPSKRIQNCRISLATLACDFGNADCVLLYRSELIYLKLDHHPFPKTFLALSILHSSKLRDEAVKDMMTCQHVACSRCDFCTIALRERGPSLSVEWDSVVFV